MATVVSSSAGAKQYENNNKKRLAMRLTFAICALVTLTGRTVGAVAIYSNIDFLSNPTFEPICAQQQERFIESDGKESSLILDFNSNETAANSCKRILSAPSAYGFIVRLLLPKIRHRSNQRTPQFGKASAVGDATTKTASKMSAKSRSAAAAAAAAAAAFNEMTSLIEKFNATVKSRSLRERNCPLSIFSSLDPHIPHWTVDPCQLEDAASEMDDPVRLFHGRVRIVWQHDHQQLDAKLMVTVLGKGDQCRGENKHQCLKIGDEPLLCISKELICDGIRHCPNSNEYDSDEDYTMCWKRRRYGEPMPALESEIFQHFALEVFRNLFAFDVPGLSGATSTTTTTTAAPSTTLLKVDTNPMGSSGAASSTNATMITDEHSGNAQRRNSTRSGLNSDLSKYGPWGYLMLGMLLCGGALLICGLWASATQHAANNEQESNAQNAANSGSSGTHQTGAPPPNYEELDPPPPYSALFPNQKAASSTTLNSLSNATATMATAPLQSSTGGQSVAQTTRVQLEMQASSSATTTTVRATP